MAYGNFRGSSGGSRGGFRPRSGGFRRSFGPREMTKIKCSECGKEDEVPFKPREGTPVYCKECYFKKKGITPKAKPEFKKESSEDFGEEATEAEDASESEEEF
jgi:CxxC-x17-CxxC domain-containing protein